MCSEPAETRRTVESQAVEHPHVSPPLGDARCGDALVQYADALAAGVCHGPVALDIADDAAGSVPNLEPPPVAGIVNIFEALAAGVDDRVSPLTSWPVPIIAVQITRLQHRISAHRGLDRGRARRGA